MVIFTIILTIVIVNVGESDNILHLTDHFVTYTSIISPVFAVNDPEINMRTASMISNGSIEVEALTQ